MSLAELSAHELKSQLQTGAISSVAATQAMLDQISSHDDSLGAFLHVDSEGALACAADIDHKRQAGTPLGLLAGLPVAVKDV
jgi:aspartyl-tRNA(Asn)/glutamyl-tRNA(Gln) amidotransferase subunit A